jgi:hypothetical protein
MDKRKSTKGQTAIYKRYTSSLKSSNTNLITRDELIACAPYLNFPLKGLLLMMNPFKQTIMIDWLTDWGYPDS